MKKKTKTTIFILIAIVLGFLYWLPAERTRRMITVRIVDAQTGEPIEGAIVFVDWFRIEGVIGLTYSVDIERKEGLTDSQGYFSMPKYSFAQYHMAAYKPGYVCWSNRDIFMKEGPRPPFWLHDGTTIKLERFRDEYSREDHANFITSMTIRKSGRSLFEAAEIAERQMSSRDEQGK